MIMSRVAFGADESAASPFSTAIRKRRAQGQGLAAFSDAINDGPMKKHRSGECNNEFETIVVPKRFSKLGLPRIKPEGTSSFGVAAQYPPSEEQVAERRRKKITEHMEVAWHSKISQDYTQGRKPSQPMTTTPRYSNGTVLRERSKLRHVERISAKANARRKACEAKFVEAVRQLNSAFRLKMREIEVAEQQSKDKILLGVRVGYDPRQVRHSEQQSSSRQEEASGESRSRPEAGPRKRSVGSLPSLMEGY